jgi:hypothetical protein
MTSIRRVAVKYLATVAGSSSLVDGSRDTIVPCVEKVRTGEVITGSAYSTDGCAACTVI